MYEPASQQPPRSWIQPLDQLAITVMVVLSLAIVGLLWGGHQSQPKVREFSWQSQVIGADDTAFVLTFNRPMDHASVEENLQIGPPLTGKFSWSGRRMFYTLNTPAPYGSQYQIALQNAREQYTGSTAKGDRIAPFTGQFRTRDRTFVYIGVQGEEDGRLILYNLTRQQKKFLTPNYLVVQSYTIDPTGTTVSFLGSDRALSPEEQLYGLKLYQSPIDQAVAPPISASATPTPSEENALGMPLLPNEILSNRDYINQKFQLSPDGQFLVVQRVSRKDPSDVGLWRVTPGLPPERLKIEAGGEFQITADSKSLAISQGEGVTLLPLQASARPKASEDTQFLAKFAKVLDFSRDGRYAAAIKFNSSTYTRSLYILDSQQGEKEYFRTKGSILQAQFDPTGRYLYCLITELIPGKVYREQPYFGAVDVKTEKFQPLLLLPEQREMTVSLAPDGLALLFDQLLLVSPNTLSQSVNSNTAKRLVDGQLVQSSYQWLLPLNPLEAGGVKALDPQRLPLLGLQPRWLP